jgi:hypothetical protein
MIWWLTSRRNSSTAALIDTTISESKLLYIYNWVDLWVPYGAAIACTLGCVLVGIYALLTSGRSYSTSFSSIVLSTRDQSLDQLASEVRDYDPLPEHVAKTCLIYVRDPRVGSGYRVWAP